MTQPPPRRDRRRAPPGRDVVLTGFAAFFLLGWTVLLVPSLIREVQRTFDQSDAGMGFAYFVNAVVYVTGTVSAGVLAGRLPRRLLLAAGPGFIALRPAGDRRGGVLGAFPWGSW